MLRDDEMNLDEKVKQARDKADEMDFIAQEIINLCDKTLMKIQLNGEVVELSIEKKQMLTQRVKTLTQNVVTSGKQLQALVEALP